MYFQNYGLRKTWLHLRRESPVSEDAPKSNMVNGPNHCFNLNGSTVSIFSNLFEGNRVGKTFF